MQIMKLLAKFRKKIGRAKSVIFDQWPYRAAMRRIPRIRAACRAQLGKLPVLPPSNLPIIYELHMLCGHRDADMGMWASWSIMRFMDGKAHLYVHSDGTLTQQDEEAWRKRVGNLTVINREQSDQAVAAALKDTTKHLYSWRCSNWASAQLVDVHYFGTAPVLLILDSDVLTFSRPEEVMESLTGVPSGFRWCNDLRTAYSSDPGTLEEVTGRVVPLRLCAGFLVAPRLTHQDFLGLDRHLENIKKDGRIDAGHFWSCQTYYALAASGWSGSAPLPKEYSNTWNSTLRDQVLRHYVGVPRVRFRYFTEGIPRIMQDARLHPPAQPAGNLQQ